MKWLLIVWFCMEPAGLCQAPVNMAKFGDIDNCVKAAQSIELNTPFQAHCVGY